MENDKKTYLEQMKKTIKFKIIIFVLSLVFILLYYEFLKYLDII